MGDEFRKLIFSSCGREIKQIVRKSIPSTRTQGNGPTWPWCWPKRQENGVSEFAESELDSNRVALCFQFLGFSRKVWATAYSRIKSNPMS